MRTTLVICLEMKNTAIYYQKYITVFIQTEPTGDEP